MNSYSGILFARPDAWSGLARTMDLGAKFTAYNVSTTGAEADARALVADFMASAMDLQGSVDALLHER